MGRFFGWVGPIAYLVTVALTCLGGAALLAPGDPLYGWYGWGHYGNPLYDLGAALMWTPLVWVPVVVWIVALLWFVMQASVIHTDPARDERWTSHLLTIGFVGRLVLMPLGVAVTLGAGGLIGAYLAGPGPAANLDLLALALWVELLNVMIALPFAVYQLCAATRLANRGLMGATGLVWHTLLAFLPLTGFIAMCGLFVNGRAAVWAAHDERIAREAVAAAQATEQDDDACVSDAGETAASDASDRAAADGQAGQDATAEQGTQAAATEQSAQDAAVAGQGSVIQQEAPDQETLTTSEPIAPAAASEPTAAEPGTAGVEPVTDAAAGEEPCAATPAQEDAAANGNAPEGDAPKQG